VTSTLEPRIPAAAAHPDRVGQSTAIEQSRAVAEVQAAILVAQRCPRDEHAARESMREVCQDTRLAEKASFKFPRGRETVQGPSVHLARELARIWGNFQYGVKELRRDDQHGQSEMLAFAWDVQTNSRASAEFIVPHMRDKTGGPVKLVDMRDIYENNANAGARRVRECIFGILPDSLVEEAKDLCQQTLERGNGDSVEARAAKAIAKFQAMGVSQAQLEAKIGQPVAKWTAQDLAHLTVTYRSLERNEVSREDEFPTKPVTAAEITSGGNGEQQTSQRQEPVEDSGSTDAEWDALEAARAAEQQQEQQ
jgi:hypothetical protein